MNKVIKCQDCGEEFILNEGEQEFYNKKGLTEPKKCKNFKKKIKNNRREVQK